MLQITVDALRGDLPTHYAHLFGDGGFRCLIHQGVHYTNAHYKHANTETIVGHVSLATGTVPAAHGMVGNVWFDREEGRLVYNIEDPEHRLLTAGGAVPHKLQGHQGRVNSLAIHPNGRWLFSTGKDGVIRRWHMSRLPAKPVCDLAMEALPDDDWVVWKDPDGPNRCWADYSPGAKRWLGWHAPVAGTDRWAHQPMDAFPDPC